MNEQYANGSIGASVRLMIRGGSLPVRGEDKMKWKYETDPYGDKCKCGKVETEMHVLLECKLYERERNTWLEVLENLAEGVSNYDSLFARTVVYPVQVAYWNQRGHSPLRIQCPMSNLTSGPETWPWGPVGW